MHVLLGCSFCCHSMAAGLNLTPGKWIPSGKQPHNYGKSQFLMAKSTINGNFQ